MNKVISILILLAQIGLTIFATGSLYMVFAFLDYKGGFENFIGLALFQPVLALLFSLLTVALCFLIGLPVRFYSKLNTWWRQHISLSLILIVGGLALCVTSLMPAFAEEVSYRMEGMVQTATVPNLILSVSGWFMLAFGTLHLYPPFGVQQKAEQLLYKRSF